MTKQDKALEMVINARAFIISFERYESIESGFACLAPLRSIHDASGSSVARIENSGDGDTFVARFGAGVSSRNRPPNNETKGPSTP